MTKQIRPKRKKADRRESCNYVIEILDWDLDYSLRLDPDHKISAGPYWEYTSLKLYGRCIEPQILSDKNIEMTILGRREMALAIEKPPDVDWEPKAIGGLTITKSQSGYLGSVPFDALQLIILGINSGKIKFISLYGEKLYRGQASVKSVSFESTYTPEENR